MTKSIFSAAFMLVSMLNGVCAAQAAENGKFLFDKFCSHCHAEGAGHPGTYQLGVTRGLEYAVLEKRGDLHQEYVRFVITNGLPAMAPFRPTELSGEQVAAIADYLGKSK
jgi:cytochrome c5